MKVGAIGDRKRILLTAITTVLVGGACGRQDTGANPVASPSALDLAPCPGASGEARVSGLKASTDAAAILSTVRARYGTSGGRTPGLGPAAILPGGAADCFVPDSDEAMSMRFSPRFGPASEPPFARVLLPRTSDAPFHLEDASTGAGIDVSVVGGRDVPARATDGYLVYAHGHKSGATLLHRPLPSGLEDFVTFDERPAVAEIAYQMVVGKGVAGLRLVANTLEMLDSEGAPRLRVAPPYLVGADGVRTDATLAVGDCMVDESPAPPWGRAVTPPGSGSCTVRVSWDDQGVVYPAVLDPRWTTTGSMTSARQGHSATVLSTGKVLVAGGGTSSTTALATAELFDRTTGTWAATGSMTGPRQLHTAVQLGTSSNPTTSGKVLVAGGWNGTATQNTSQLYSPTAGTWIAAATMNAGRHAQAAAVLADGRVLVAGGLSGTMTLTSAALYNPASGSGAWSATTGPLPPMGQKYHTATLLVTSNTQLNNKVLLVGGNSGTATVSAVFLFDPAQSAFSTLASMPSAHEGHTATLLPNGNLLITGGRNGSATVATTAIFNPSIGPGSWSSAGTMTTARQGHTATLLAGGVIANGQVLVAGGSNGTSTLSSAELFNGTNAWTATTAMPTPVQGHTASLLSNGGVLIAGGVNGTTTNAARIYDASFGLGCTSNSQCTTGFCASGVCCDTACTGSCMACNLAGSVGTCSPKANGASCADGNMCNGAETCLAGACQPGTPLVCFPPDACHTEGSCVPATGCPAPVAIPEGGTCDDTNPNTTMSTCIAATCRGAQPPYTGAGTYGTLTDLGALNGADDSLAIAINNTGAVAGEDDSGGISTGPWRYTAAGQLQAITFASGGVGHSTAINGDAVVVGSMNPTAWSNGHAFAFTATPGSTATLPLGSASNSWATGINDAGQIAGYKQGGEAFRLTGTTIVNIPRLPATRFTGADITAGIGPGGEVVGYAQTSDASRTFPDGVTFQPPGGIREAFLFSDMRGMVNLNDEPVVTASTHWELLANAQATNGSQIVGWGVTGGLCHAFRYTVGQEIVDLGIISGPTTDGADLCAVGSGLAFYEATSVNKRGEVVGTVHGATGPVAAFYFSDATQMVSLQDFIDPTLHETLVSATGINDSGQIVGTLLVDGDPKVHAFSMKLPKIMQDVAEAPSTADIALRFEGIANFSDTDRVAIFSYTNNSGQNIKVPYGPASPTNTLSINTQVQDSFAPPVPELFLGCGHPPCDHPAALLVPWFSGTTKMTWTVGIQTADALDTATPLKVTPTPDGNGSGPTLPTGQVNIRPTYAATILASEVATDFITDSLGNKIPAGGLPGTLDVTPDGAARYVVPIDVPPGRNGVQPHLALEYNSRAGDGPLGIGFGLSGLSQITRCRKTRAQDGAPAPIKFDSSDVFCLDGARLVAVPPSDPSIALEFRTASESYSRITVPSSGVDNSGPVVFEVRTADGLIHRYTSDSRQEVPRVSPARGPNQVDTDTLAVSKAYDLAHPARLTWNLSSSRDRYGNAITYKYNYFGNSSETDYATEAVIASISYTDYVDSTGTPSAALSPTQHSVEFSYETRPDSSYGYISGLRYQRTQRCTAIKTKYRGDTVREYRIKYDDIGPPNDESRVNSIAPCDSAGLCFPATEFNWTTSSTVFDDHLLDLNDVSGDVAFGDFNGDGLDDIVYRSSSHWTARMGTGTSFGPPVNIRLASSQGAVPAKRIRVIDLNMDGRSDLVVFDDSQWRSYTSNGDGTSFSEMSGPQFLARQDVPHFGDLNGDGFPDVVQGGDKFFTDFADMDFLHWEVSFNDAGSFGPFQQAPLFLANPLNSLNGTHDICLASLAADANVNETFLVGSLGDIVAPPLPMNLVDVTGTGAVSLLGGVAGGHGGCSHLIGDIFENLSDVRFTSDGWSGALANLPGIGVTPIFIDINGDGLLDAVIPFTTNSISTPANLYINTGNGFIVSDFQGLETLMPESGGNIVATDWNGDGRQDLMYLSNTNSDNDRRKTAQIEVVTGLFPANKYHVFETPVPTDPISGSGVHTVGEHSGQILDANGDGLDDLFQHEQDGYHLHVRFGERPNLLKGIDTGLGRNDAIVYKSLIEFTGTYTASKSCPAPTYCVRRGPQAVIEVHHNGTMESTGGARNDLYHYLDARLDLDGLGWIGVGQRQVLTTAIRSLQDSDLIAGGIKEPPVAWVTTEYGDAAFERIGGSYPKMARTTSETALIPTSPDTVPAVQPIPAPPPPPPPNPTRRSTTTTAYETVLLAPGRYVTREQKRTRSDDESPDGLLKIVVGGTTWTNFRAVTETFSYDPDGGGLNGHTMSTGDGYSATDIVTNEPDNLGDWIIHRPHRIEVTETDRQGRQAKRVAEVDHDPKGFVSETRIEPDDVSNPDSEVFLRTHYDRAPASGVVTRIVQSDVAQNRRVTSFIWTSDDLNTNEIVNPEGHHVLTAIDPKFGVPVATVDPNGVVTTRTVDGFGRLKSQTTDGSGGETWSYLPAQPFPKTNGMQIVDQTAGGKTRTLVLDELGRVIEDHHIDDTGVDVLSDISYESYRLNTVSVSRPHHTDEIPQHTVVQLDDLGRVISEIKPANAKPMTANYSGLSIDAVDEVGVKTHALLDQSGHVIESRTFRDDGAAVITSYEYSVDGLVEAVHLPGSAGATKTIDYDRQRRPTTVSDPDAGSSTIHYNAFGDVVLRVDGNKDQRFITPDRLGRPIEMRSKDGLETLEWDTAPSGIGSIASLSEYPADSVLGIWNARSAYDSLGGRLVAETVTTGSHVYSHSRTFDQFGRVETAQFPAVAGQPLVLRYGYSPFTGELRSVSDDGSTDPSRIFWKASDWDREGRVKTATLGNRIVEMRTYDEVGNIASIVGTNAVGQTIQSMTYVRNSAGNVIDRFDNVLSIHDEIGYDAMNRLQTWTCSLIAAGPSSTWLIQYPYDDAGNVGGRKILLGNGDDLVFRYGEADHGGGPHSITSSPYGTYRYDGAGQQVSAPGRPVMEFGTNGMPITIQDTTGTTVHLGYDPLGRRVKKVGPDGTTVYIGAGYEHHEGLVNSEVINVQAGGWTVAQIVTPMGGSADISYLHEDALGSTCVVTSEAGEVRERRTYDPWGKRYDWQTSPLSEVASAISVVPGFIGAIDDGDVGLVNLNARLYDPRVGRFISPDPIVPHGLRGQSFNRYSYADNNPLTFRDISGLNGTDTGDEPSPSPPMLPPLPIPPGPDPRPMDPCAGGACGPPPPRGPSGGGYSIPVHTMGTSDSRGNSPTTVLGPLATSGGMVQLNPEGLSFTGGGCDGISAPYGYYCLGEATSEGKTYSAFAPANGAPNGVVNAELNRFGRFFARQFPGRTLNPDTKKAIEGAAILAPLIGGTLVKAIEELAIGEAESTLAEQVVAKTLAGKGNFTSATRLSADEALEAGERFVAPGYSEIGKPGSGVFRSADGTRQFRMDSNSLAGSHAPGEPHVHFETYEPGGRFPTSNNHVPFDE